MPVVPMVIVTATIAVCQTIEESIAVTISVSSVSSSVSSVVMIGGIVTTVMSTVTSVEVTHIVPGGEEWSELRITCITFIFCCHILNISRQIPLETSVIHIGNTSDTKDDEHS